MKRRKEDYEKETNKKAREVMKEILRSKRKGEGARPKE